jgi:hypothetical protein
MQIAAVSYRTRNLGDYIQQFALEQLCPGITLYVDRDNLTPAAAWDSDVRWIICGWFSAGVHHPWPPPGRSHKLFIGFHATDARLLPTSPELPIGCRDPWTLGLCKRRAIRAWLSYCITLTLPCPAEARTDEVILVDVPKRIYPSLPRSIRDGNRVTHFVEPGGDHLAGACAALARYARARCVVTTRLHALLPCAAMGTPVVLAHRQFRDKRFVGYTRLAWAVGNAPWDNPTPRVDPADIKETMRPLRQAVEEFTRPDEAT